MKMVVFSTYAIQFDLKMTTLIRYDYNSVLLGFAINIYYENLRSKRTQDRNQNWTHVFLALESCQHLYHLKVGNTNYRLF